MIIRKHMYFIFNRISTESVIGINSNKVKNKRLLFIVSVIIVFSLQHIFFNTNAQVPETFSYQCILRHGDKIIKSQKISMRISIIENNPVGTLIYQEKHVDTTAPDGMVSLEIGAGEVKQGNFDDIRWGEQPYFIKIDTDLSGRDNYTAQKYGQRLLSVPYALLAASSSNVNDADHDTLNEIQHLIVNNDFLTISKGHSQVDLSVIADGTLDSDHDTANELSTAMHYSGDTLSITDSGGIHKLAFNLPAHDNDPDTLNETIERLDLNDENVLYIVEYSGDTNIIDLSYYNNKDLDIRDQDHDTLNEIQGLYLDTTAYLLSLTHNNKIIDEAMYQADLTAYAQDTQDLSSYKQDSMVYLSITGGDTVAININDRDTDTTNELQTLAQVLETGNDADSMRIKNVGNINVEDLLAAWDNGFNGYNHYLANKRIVDEVFLHEEKRELQQHDNMMWYGETWGKLYDPANDEIYRFTQIGDQVWMAENLRGTKYSDGTNISTDNYALYPPHDMDGDGDPTAKDTALYKEKFGYLYSHYAIDDDDKINVICPEGWKLPTFSEFTELINYVGGTNKAGIELKADHTWSILANLDDEYGFSALPAMGMNESKIPFQIERAYFITDDNGNFGGYYIEDGSNKINTSVSDGTQYFYSIRCIKQ